MEHEPDELGVLGKEIDGRYRLDRFIGAGTMGAVYEGKQLAVGRRVAVKLLNAALQTNQQVRGRFRVEAQAIATLSHTNCVTLYDFGYSEEIGALYMAVEFLDGEPLDRLIQRGIEPRTAMLIARQIADVLVVAHEAGIMHRDLKPENVMVIRGADGQPHAKVLDFGLARIFEDATGGARLTRQGQLFGTPAYMSPEQCRSAMDVGPPSDIYALGVSMFEMLMGHLPFESPSVPELLVLHSTKTAPPVATNDEVPLVVSAMIARMMAKNPEDRPSADDVASILDAVLQGEPPPPLPPPSSVSGEREVVATRATLGLARPSEDVTSTGMTLEPAGQKTPALAIGALVLAGAFLLGAIGVALTGDDPVDADANPAPPPVVAEPTPAEPPVEPPVVEERPFDEFGLAPDLAEDKGAHVANVLAASAASHAEALAPVPKPKSSDKPPKKKKKSNEIRALNELY